VLSHSDNTAEAYPALLGQSDSSRTFSSGDAATPNYDNVTLASSSSYLQWRPSKGNVTAKSDDCDAFSNGLASCKFVHQAIGQIVTSLENCEERNVTHWVTPKHRGATMETYV
jgi:hypothetical protein